MTALGIGGAAAAGVGGLWMAPRARADDKASSGDGPGGRQFAEAIIAAFGRHRLVAIGEVHGQQEHADAMQILLTDPRLPGVVDDIVVEYGNTLYQSTMDKFVTGAAVEDADLRLVWRNTTQSPSNTWDTPCYEQFFRTVRAVNWNLPTDQRIRVLLGDPPVDWSTVRTPADVRAISRDGNMASVVEQEVLAKGRRALILYGTNHVKHDPGAVVGLPRSNGAPARRCTSSSTARTPGSLQPPGAR